MTQRNIAILVDGGFFLKRLPRLVGANRCDNPGRVAACIRRMCHNHIKSRRGELILAKNIGFKPMKINSRRD